MRTEHAFDHGDALADHLAHRIAVLLRVAIQLRGHASLAVSGGQSPIPVFERLSRQPLPWRQVTITLVDERCVPVNHPDSNARLVRAHLIQNEAAQAQWAPPWHGTSLLSESADSEAIRLTACESQLLKVPHPLDVVLLGMGTDGHTASWFPCSADLQHALHTSQACTVVHPRTARHTRLTLTRRTILASRHVLLQLSGREKQAVYRMACQRADDRWPVSHVLTAMTPPVEVWLAP